MRRGCIAIGKMECDSCHRPIGYGERYLLVDGEGDERQHLCTDCCQSRGYVSYGTDKGKQIITFLPKE
jgi:predicted CXXCH cytochrome family protein